MVEKREGVRVDRQFRPGEKRSGERSDLGRFSQYKPLKVSKERTVEICLETELFKKPTRSSEPPKNTSEKYCSFHRRHGHDTSECQKLDQELKRVIQRNARVKDLIARPRERSPPRKISRGPPWTRSTRADPRSPPREKPQESREKAEPARYTNLSLCGFINMISGGSTNGDSNRARKAWSRSESYGREAGANGRGL